MSNTPGEFPKPSRRELLRPVEFLVGAAIAAVFTGLIVLMATREPVLSAVFAGAAFIVVLVVLAMSVLAFKPDEHELVELEGDAPDEHTEDRPGLH